MTNSTTISFGSEVETFTRVKQNRKQPEARVSIATQHYLQQSTSSVSFFVVLILFHPDDSSTTIPTTTQSFTMATRDNTTFTYSSVPVPHDRREEADQMREAIAASLNTTVDQVDPELVRRNLGHVGGSSNAPRRSRASRLPLARGVFC